jgi:hypothetical protein
MKIKTKLAVALSAALLSACGGGSDSSPAAPVASTAATTFPLDTAYTQVSTAGISLNGTAVDGADTWTMALSVTPAADQTFEGATAKKSVQSITIKKNGATVVSSGGESFFTINPFNVKGLKLNDGSYGVQTVAGGALSNVAKVGDSGSLGTVTIYSNSSKSSVLFTQEATWTLEADTATTAFGCSNTTAKSTAGAVIATTSGCYKIDTNGTVKGLKYTLALAGKTLVFR